MGYLLVLKNILMTKVLVLVFCFCAFAEPEVKLELTGNILISEQEIIDLGLINLNSKQTLIETGSIRDRLQRNAWIENVEVVPDLVHSLLKIHIVEAKPWFILDEGKRKWIVSKKGSYITQLKDLLYEEVDTKRLLNVVAGENVSLSLLFHKILKQIKHLQAAWTIKYKIEKVVINHDSSLTLFFEGIEPIAKVKFNSLVEAKSVVKRMLSVIDDLLKRGEVNSIIDLRYSNQAVVSKKKIPKNESLDS